jgi:hypothetical protein
MDLEDKSAVFQGSSLGRQGKVEGGPGLCLHPVRLVLFSRTHLAFLGSDLQYSPLPTVE